MRERVNRFILETKNEPSLKRIFFIVTLHAILPAIFIILVLQFGQREVAIKTYENNLSQIVNFSANAYEEELLKAKNMLILLSNLPCITSQNSEVCTQLLTGLLSDSNNKQYSSLAAADKNGTVYCTSSPRSKGVNLDDREYFSLTKSSERFVVSEVLKGRISGKETIVTSYPVFNQKQEFDGAVLAGIDIDWLGKLAHSVNFPDYYTLTVLDKNGVVIARHPNASTWIGKDVKDTAFGKALFNQQNPEGRFKSIGLDQKKRLHAYTTIEKSIGEGEIYVVLGSPEEESMHVANQTLTRDIVIILLIILSAILICSIDLALIFKNNQLEPKK